MLALMLIQFRQKRILLSQMMCPRDGRRK
jgi:hypothetical protein